MKVADCDLHIFEPPDLWQRYIDPAFKAPAFKHIAPVGLTEVRRDMRVRVKSRIVDMRNGRPRLGATLKRAGWRERQDELYLPFEERDWNPTSQKEAMDA